MQHLLYMSARDWMISIYLTRLPKPTDAVSEDIISHHHCKGCSCVILQFTLGCHWGVLQTKMTVITYMLRKLWLSRVPYYQELIANTYGKWNVSSHLVSVPDPKLIPVWITFSTAHGEESFLCVLLNIHTRWGLGKRLAVTKNQSHGLWFESPVLALTTR